MSEDEFEEVHESKEDVSASRWQDNLHRILRRAEIAKQLGANESLNDVKTAVREWEEKIGVKKVVEWLVQEEFLVNEKMAKLAEGVFERVSTRYPQIKAVVLMGSAVNGGAQMREILGSFEEADFDWGVIYDLDKKPDLKNLIAKKELYFNSVGFKNYSEEVVRDVGVDLGLGEKTHSCSSVNPVEYNAPPLNGIADAKRLLMSNADFSPFQVKDKSFLASRISLMYFDPSFPKEVNQTNRGYILEALGELSKEDPALWKKSVGILTRVWEGVHKLKYKHLVNAVENAESQRDIALRDDVSRGSEVVMSAAMRAVLESTARK